jgi:flagellar biosynthesis GTPase FlhF
MSDQPPAPTHPHAQQVRTYRGRTLEEVIPQIRAELGPDAVILREREGLIGGVSGFFQKRCVEVEACAALPQIDVYDDEDDATPEMIGMPDTPPPPSAPTEPPYGRTRKPSTARKRHSEPAIAEPEPITSEPEPSFAEQLAQAEDEAVAAAPVEPHSPVDGAEAISVAEPEPEAIAEPETDAEAIAEPETDAEAIAEPEPDAEPDSIAEPIAESEIESAGEPEPESISDAVLADEPEPESEPVAEVLPEPAAEPVAAATAAGEIVPVPKPRSPRTRRVHAPKAPKIPHRSPAVKQRPAGTAVDQTATTSIAHELTARGVSARFAADVILQAAAHAGPLANDGGLRNGVRATLARRLPLLPQLPAEGAAVAFVGAGGAGKTRCAAALAAAYGSASTLSVSVVSLGGAAESKSIGALLSPRGVPTTAITHANRAAKRIEERRSGGLVVIDTPAIVPSDERAAAAAAQELTSLPLDAVYVVIPATFSPTSARQVLHAVQPFGPTAIVVTHADETDQLGVAFELACATGMPIAYVNDGLDLDTSLTAPDAYALAARLLP